MDTIRNTHDIRLEPADNCEKQCQIIFTRNDIGETDNDLLANQSLGFEFTHESHTTAYAETFNRKNSVSFICFNYGSIFNNVTLYYSSCYGLCTRVSYI